MKCSQSSHHEATILIVEDSPTQNVILRHVLEKQGYQVISKTNGEEALLALPKCNADLIISDVLMPKMNGFELCRAIKQNPSFGQIPIILMTALEGIEEIGQGIAAGADQFIYKPYKPEVLLMRVRSVLNHCTRLRSDTKQGKYTIELDGKAYVLSFEPERILGLLISSFEDAIWLNQALKRGEKTLQATKEDAEMATIKKGKFLATMSHEIRTPMMGIIGLLELLSLSKLDSDQHKTLGTIYESSRSLVRLIDDILDYSRIEAGKISLSPKAASIDAVIKQLHSLFSGAASRKGLVLKTYYDSKISQALCFDPLRVQQILGHFISNAIKFTNEGEVELRVDLVERLKTQEQIKFTVKDTGIGMSPSHQKRLFMPFLDLESQGKNDFSGVGIGLVISKRLSELMHGTIETISALSQGTSMSLTLTLTRADPKDLESPESLAPINYLAEELANRRSPPTLEEAIKEHSLVLVVDDHPVNRKVLMRLINTLGYAVEGAESGAEALALLNTKPYALMVTDCNMPSMSGYELAGKVRQLEKKESSSRLPIIACTANAEKTGRQDCLKAGMDDVLVKPVGMMDLVRCLDRWLPLSIAPPVDRAMLVDIVGDDEEAQHEILLDFKGANERDIELLERAIQKQDLTEIMNLAHRIKGACQMVGAKQLANVCKHIDEASRAGDMKAVSSQQPTLQEAVKRLQKYLSSL